MRLFLTLSLLQPRQNAENISKTNEEVICGDIITLTISSIKICQKYNSQPSLGHGLYFLLMFPLIISIF